ncbi:MAG: DUF1638 domain-containing protein [Armatimonadota bacterium]
MRIKLIACEVFARELMLAAATSPHVVDLVLMPFGLHDTPDKLRAELQKAVDAVPSESFDYMALGYGLCSRGTVGIRARSTPLVVPRAHDCITLLLGSRARYQEQFSHHPGTYYYSPGWIERKTGEVEQGIIDDAYRVRAEQRFREYVEKYGEDNARFLLEQESLWIAHYTRAAFINTGLGNVEAYRRFTKNLAEERNWEYAELPGDTDLLRKLAHGEWDKRDFLTIRPGASIAESFDDYIVREESNS